VLGICGSQGGRRDGGVYKKVRAGEVSPTRLGVCGPQWGRRAVYKEVRAGRVSPTRLGF
jgi:hypothetical protein